MHVRRTANSWGRLYRRRTRAAAAPNEVIQNNDNSSGPQNSHVSIEGEERQGSEDVKMRLDAPSTQMNKQSSHEHLRHGDHLTGERSCGLRADQVDGQAGEKAAKKDREPDVKNGRRFSDPTHASGDQNRAKAIAAGY